MTDFISSPFCHYRTPCVKQERHIGKPAYRAGKRHVFFLHCFSRSDATLESSRTHSLHQWKLRIFGSHLGNHCQRRGKKRSSGREYTSRYSAVPQMDVACLYVYIIMKYDLELLPRQCDLHLTIRKSSKSIRICTLWQIPYF